MTYKLAFLALLVISPAVAATAPNAAAVWNVLPPKLAGHSGTLFFACKTPAGLGPMRSIIADFTNGNSHEVPVSPDDAARIGKPYRPSLRKCAADCGTEVFLTRVPPDPNDRYPKLHDITMYDYSLMMSRNGTTRSVGRFGIGNPNSRETGEPHRFFQDLTVAPDAGSFLLAIEGDEYYFLTLGNEHPSLILSPQRWGREYCSGQKKEPDGSHGTIWIKPTQ